MREPTFAVVGAGCGGLGRWWFSRRGLGQRSGDGDGEGGGAAALRDWPAVLCAQSMKERAMRCGGVVGMGRAVAQRVRPV